MFYGSVIHYLVAKIFGPLLFNRGWCGWACWTAMILDLLPFDNSEGRVKGLGKIRYVHFALSLGMVLGFLYLVGYSVKSQSLNELYWLLCGNAVYYALGIGLAVWLKDNRAFCKYVCPITTFLKAGSRYSLLKIDGDPDECVGCGNCTDACPMDIKVDEYVRDESRVLSTECIFCMECVNSCPEGILDVEEGFDTKCKEKLVKR
ncbi:MAG: 4Fe-4S binding protein [Thermoplasmatota archaeon]